VRPIDSMTAALLRHRVRGAGRAAALIYSHRSSRAVPARLNGLRWEADPLDWMDEQVIRHGTYEPEITGLLVDLLPEGGCLWDVGANAGVHSLSVKAQRPDVQVVAFEPSPAEFLRLLRNAEVNRLEVAAYCIALADGRGYQQLSVVAQGNSGHNSLLPWREITYSSTLPVWCDTGDDLINEGVRPPDVLKVDVEGAEPAVFAGMPRALRGLRHVAFEAPGPEAPAVQALTDADFDVRPISAGNWLASRRA
jgi:FkbM family methyltransferase